MKGQWFIVSAVVVTTFFVAISGLLRDYFIADFAPAVTATEDFYFENVKQGMTDAVRASPPDCAGIDKNLAEFIEFSRKNMAEFGYLQDVAILNRNCPAKIYTIQLNITSNKFKKTETFTT